MDAVGEGLVPGRRGEAGGEAASFELALVAVVVDGADDGLLVVDRPLRVVLLRGPGALGGAVVEGDRVDDFDAVLAVGTEGRARVEPRLRDLGGKKGDLFSP